MPDGIATVAPVFTQNEDGTYQSVSTVGATSITTSYDENFEKTGTVVSKTYETVLSLVEMTDKFQSAWNNIADQLPAEFLNSESPVQFALNGNQWLAIATADSGDVSNGDILGRITSWDNEGNEGTGTRWIYDSEAEEHKEFDVESSDWSFNFHDADWNYVARSGGREVTLVKETGSDELLNGGEGEPDETGTHTQSMVRKDDVSEDLWGELTSILSDSILGLMADGAVLSSVENLRIEENAWSGESNSYRAEDETWSDSEIRTAVYGDVAGNGSNDFLGSVTKRDGFVVVRDDAWNEVARLIDPDAEGTGYSDMAAKYDGFADAWSEIGDELPSVFKDDEGNTIEEELSYTTDQWDNILVFSQTGAMIGRINQWSYTDTWDRSWDDEFPQETFSNKNFEFRVVTDDGDYDVGRFESGYKTLINTNRNAVTESQWTQVNVSVIERNSEADAWAAYDATYFEGTVATALDVDWVEVDRIEISNNNYTYNPVGWREELETESSTSVRFYSEAPNNGNDDDPDWYRTTFLGSVEKRDGFIEIRDENWNTVARLADLAGDNIKDWAFIETQYDGIKGAWDSVAEFLPDNLSAYADLKYTVDDRHVYAFTAAGEMVGQINFWSGEDTWMRYFGDDLVSIKNINYNYNFHDANWNNLANAGGNERYIVGEDGSLILDEKGSHSGVNVRKVDSEIDDWNSYDPDVSGIITWADVTEIRQQSNSWESISDGNPYREDDETWSDSNEQIQYYQEATNANGDGLGWNKFAGSMETRDGFIEIRDDTWTIVAQRINATSDNPALDFAELSAEYLGIASAWEALTLPAELANKATLKFTTDKWDNVLIFDAAGEMVGKVNYWTHTNTWERSWDDDYPSETYTNANYNFEIIESSGNNWNWVDVGRYEVGNTKFNITDDNGNPAQVLNDSWTEVSSTVYERSAPDAFLILGDDVFPNSAATALDFPWDTVDKVEISSSTRVHSDEIMWRDEEETNTSTSVRLYEESDMNGYFHSQFLGTIEKFDGFIQVRDSNWDVVFQGLDLTDSDSLMEWSEVILAYEGLQDAWENVEGFFTDERLREDDLKFTTDDSTIYAFTATGVMIGQINYWTGSHAYTRFYDDQEYTVRAVDYNYSFHDDDWQQLANSSGNKRYIVTHDENGAEVLVLDEQGSNVGFTAYLSDIVDDADAAVWNDYNPDDDTGTIDFASVTEIRYETRKWESVDNEFRQIKDADGVPVLDDGAPTYEEGWSDESVQIRYYEESADGSRTEFSGTKERRDGFIEIRDEHWNTVSQKIDGGGLTFAEMIVKYQGFAAAWNALEDTLPSEFRDSDPDSGDFGNHLGESFAYTVDKWDNILIFDATGVMIGKVNYWSHSNTNDRSWDSEYVAETHFNSNFNFQFIQANDYGGTDWIDVGSYEAGSNTYISYDGDTPVEELQRAWEGVGSTSYRISSDPDAWAASGNEHYLDILATALGFTWDEVGKIEVSSDTSIHYAIGWRDELEENTSEGVKFYKEKPADGNGNGYHSEFLGSIDKNDGFIEIRDANWETVASFVDTDAASTFAEITTEFDGLATAWTKVSEYLPDAAADTDSLSFTSDDNNIFVFDTAGIMIMQVGQWSWKESYTNSDVLIAESGYGFDFNDDNWNRYASYRAEIEYISDDENDPDMDRSSETIRYRVKKADMSALEWAKLDPGDDSGTINWAEISEVSIGESSWASHTNWNRTEDETYSSSEDRTEYFMDVENVWGDTFQQFVGAKEVQGNLARIYDSEWTLVNTDVDGPLDGALLSTVLDGTDAELIRVFEATLSKYIDLETAEIIDSENGPSVLVVDGEIFGTVRPEERFEDGGMQLYWSYDVQDINGDNIIRMGGWNAVSEANNAATKIAKPNGVSLSEFIYKEAVDAETWGQLETQYSIDVEGFDWDQVGIIEKQVWKDDWEGDGDYTTREDIRFIKVDEVSGRQIWDYFRLEIVGSAITIKNSANEVVGQSVVGDVDALPSLSDESLLGPDFENVFSFLKTQFEAELNLEIAGFTDGSIGYAGESAVVWSSADGQEIRIGELHINNDDSNSRDYFHVRFKNDEGKNEFDIGGHVNTDSDGKFLFTDYDVFFADYAYETDTAAWDALLETNGPIAGSAIVMDNVEVLQHRTSYEDYSGSGVMEFNREELRFLKGEVREDGHVQINWDWETDDRLVFQDGFEKHYIGEYLVSSSISRDTSLVTTDSVWDVDTYDFADFADLLLAEGTFSAHLAAAENLKLSANEDDDKLYVFQSNGEGSEELSLIVTNTSAAWAAEFGAEKGYEFMHGDGQYAGWVYSEIDNTFKDAAGVEHSNVSLVSSQLYFNSEGSSLSLAAWKHIHDQFDTAESANYEFYDLTAVGLRSVERTWTVDGVVHTNERVLVNHRLDSGWQDMVGFERTITDDDGTVDTGDYTKITIARNAPDSDETWADAVSLGPADQAVAAHAIGGFEASIDSVLNGVPFDDSVVLATIPSGGPDAVMDLAMDAEGFAEALVSLEGLYGLSAEGDHQGDSINVSRGGIDQDSGGEAVPLASPEVVVSDDGMGVTITMNGEEDEHVVSITSTSSGFGSSLQTYITNANTSLVDIVDFMDSFVAAAIGEENLTDLAYSAVYSYDDDVEDEVDAIEVRTLSISDAGVMNDYEPITDSDGNIFLVNFESATTDDVHFNIFTADGVFNLDVDGAETLVGYAMEEDDSLTLDQAIELTVEDLISEVIGGEDEVDPFFV